MRECEKVDRNEKVTNERDCKKVSKDNIKRERMWDGVNVCKSLREFRKTKSETL